MASSFGRWIKYAQAKLEHSLRSSNDELDRREAEREAELAERPWLGADGDAPTFDEARRRIEHEAAVAERARAADRAADPDDRPAARPTGAAPGEPSGADGRGEAPSSGSPGAPAIDPEDPEVAAARIELDRRARASEERLDEIRRELGVEPPAES